VTADAPNGPGRAYRGFGQCTFAVAPGNFFDSHNATAATLDAPHGVQKEDEESPQRDEFKTPLGELVVSRRRQMAARADCGRTLARSHGYFDALLVRTEMSVLVDKTPETIAAVQNRDQFHGAGSEWRRTDGVNAVSQRPRERDAVIDARTLPRVQMPNRNGFVVDPRPDVGKKPK